MSHRRKYESSKRPTSLEQLEDMQGVLPEVARQYVGEAILAPAHAEFAKALGKSAAMMYHYGTSYAEKLETITGLKVVHNAVVLGYPESVKDDFNFDFPQVKEQSDPVEQLARQIESLTEEDRASLLARLAISSTRNS